jgi:YHS domain-containing protein
MDRIDDEFSAAERRVESLREQQVQEFHGRQERLERFSSLLEQLRDIWYPRLVTLSEKFGERVEVFPEIAPGRRCATFAFKSDLARIRLRFAVSPDADVRHLTFAYDLEIIPILMKFAGHDQIEFPLEAVDAQALGQWIDDRIVDFVKTYLSLNENQYYLRDHMVEDPIAHVRFPKQAAGAVREIDGKTYYFLDQETLREFERQQAPAVAGNG